MKAKKAILKSYLSIEGLPIWNFYQVKEKEDERYLFILDDYTALPEVWPDEKIWQGIQDEVYEKIGFNDSQSDQLYKVIKLQQLTLDIMAWELEDEHDPRLSRARVDLASLEKELYKPTKPESFVEILANMERYYFHYQVDARKMSTAAWFIHLNLFEKEIENDRNRKNEQGFKAANY